MLKNKNTIGFVGAPWTLLVYMINQKSPKKRLKSNFFNDNFLINRILLIIEKFLKIHIKNRLIVVRILFKYLIVGQVCWKTKIFQITYIHLH